MTQFKIGDRVRSTQERLGFPLGFESVVEIDDFCKDEDGDWRPLLDDCFELVTTPTPDERAVAPELVERMIALIKKDLERYPSGQFAGEARTILAALARGRQLEKEDK